MNEHDKLIEAVIERLLPTVCRGDLCKDTKFVLRDYENNCGARYGDYTCTRKLGHEGPHIACVVNIPQHNLATWPNE